MLLLWGPIKWPAYAVGELLACELEYLQEKKSSTAFSQHKRKRICFLSLALLLIGAGAIFRNRDIKEQRRLSSYEANNWRRRVK
jgi:hypothetical protein